MRLVELVFSVAFERFVFPSLMQCLETDAWGPPQNGRFGKAALVAQLELLSSEFWYA